MFIFFFSESVLICYILFPQILVTPSQNIEAIVGGVLGTAFVGAIGFIVVVLYRRFLRLTVYFKLLTGLIIIFITRNVFCRH